MRKTFSRARIRRSRLTFGWLLVFGLTIGPTFTAMFGYELYARYRAELAGAQEDTQRLARALEQFTLETFDSIDGLMRLSADRIGTENLVRPDAQPGLQSMLAAVASTLGLSRLEFHSTGPADAASPAEAGLPGPAEPGATVPSAITTRQDTATGRRLLSITRHVVDADGMPAGTLVADLDARRFQKFYETLHVGANGAAALLRDDGLVLAREPPSPLDLGVTLTARPEFMQQLAKSPHGVSRAQSALDGVERIFAYRKVDRLPLVVVVGVAADDVLADFYQSSSWAVVVWAVACAILGALFIAIVHGAHKQERIRAVAHAANQRFERLVSHVPGAVFQRILRPDGRMTYSYIGGRVEEIFGHSGADIMRDPSLTSRAIHPDDRDRFLAAVQESAAALSPLAIEKRVCPRPGETRWIHTSSIPERNGAGQVVWDGLVVDITERKLAEAALREREREAARAEAERIRTAQATQKKLVEAALFEAKARAAVTLRSIADGVITTDVEGRVDYLNPAAEAMTGWSLADASGQPLDPVFHILDETTRQPAQNPLWEALRKGETVSLSDHAVLLMRGGTVERAIEETAAPIRDHEGAIVGGVLVFRDVTHSRKVAGRLSHQATHDPLTSLPNRKAFEEAMGEALEGAQRHHESHVAMFLDLDHFKIVNDTCGHIAGDELLRQIASALRARLRQGDMLARLGGDEFGVLLGNCPLDSAKGVAEKLLRTVTDFRFGWEGKTFSVGASIGLVSAADGVLSINEMLMAADAACYIAKDAGRNRVHVYRPNDAELNRRRSRMGWMGRIQRALEKDRFVLYAQEILPLDAEPGSSDGWAHFELLLRMRDEDGELVLPSVFIPAAERYGQMPALDRWVVRNAFEILDRWATSPDSRGLVKTCAINLSGASLNDDGFRVFVRDQFAAHEAIRHLICFEVTETTAIANLEAVTGFMADLRRLGCRFSLDDFGTGMSSFGYLKHLPVDYLKIDGRFVVNLVSDPIDRAMVQAINTVGHLMQIQTIAEWAEDGQTVQALREIGVDFAQGYGIARPQPFGTAFLDAVGEPDAARPLTARRRTPVAKIRAAG